MHIWVFLCVVSQIRRQPIFRVLQVQAFALGIVLHLISVDLADGKVGGFGVGEVEAADGGGGHHGLGFGEPDAGVLLHFQQVP